MSRPIPTALDIARAELVMAEMRRQSPADAIHTLAEALCVSFRLGEIAADKTRAADAHLNEQIADLHDQPLVTEVGLPATCLVGGRKNIEGGIDDLVVVPVGVDLDTWGRRDAEAALLDYAESREADARAEGRVA